MTAKKKTSKKTETKGARNARIAAEAFHRGTTAKAAAKSVAARKPVVAKGDSIAERAKQNGAAPKSAAVGNSGTRAFIDSLTNVDEKRYATKWAKKLLGMRSSAAPRRTVSEKRALAIIDQVETLLGKTTTTKTRALPVRTPAERASDRASTTAAEPVAAAAS